jgi:hypothetical protein
VDGAFVLPSASSSSSSQMAADDAVARDDDIMATGISTVTRPSRGEAHH